MKTMVHQVDKVTQLINLLATSVPSPTNIDGRKRECLTELSVFQRSTTSPKISRAFRSKSGVGELVALLH